MARLTTINSPFYAKNDIERLNRTTDEQVLANTHEGVVLKCRYFERRAVLDHWLDLPFIDLTSCIL